MATGEGTGVVKYEHCLDRVGSLSGTFADNSRIFSFTSLLVNDFLSS